MSVTVKLSWDQSLFIYLCIHFRILFAGLFDSCRWKDLTDTCNGSDLPMSVFSEVKQTILASREYSTVKIICTLLKNSLLGA